MVSIHDYPDKDGLENWLIQLWESSVNSYAEANGIEGYPFSLTLDEIIVVGRYGKGTAEKGNHPLIATYAFSSPTPVEESDTEDFSTIADVIVPRISEVLDGVANIEGVDVVPPPPASDWFTGADVLTPPVPQNLLEDFFQTAVMNNPGPDQAYSLTNREYLIWDEEITYFHTDFRREVTEEEAEGYPDPAIDERLTGTVSRVQPEEEESDETEVFDLDEEEEDEDHLALADLDITKHVDEDSGSVEVPTGKKQSTTVEYRDLYDFEVEMLAPGDGDTDISIDYGIGQAIATGSLGQDAPAITFPRTGVYVRNRLMFEGAAYVRELHKDMCRYSWGIIEEHKVFVRPGLYENFRNMIFKLKDADLIRPLSQQEAASRGLEVTPTTPDGRRATFLEPRNFYVIVDGEEDRDAWFDVTAALYG